MALRITSTSDATTITVRVEGRLAAEGVPELLAACRLSGKKLHLDLSDMQSADTGGVQAVRLLLSRGATSHGESPYIRELLNEA